MPKELSNVANEPSSKHQASEQVTRIDAMIAEMVDRHAKGLDILAGSDAAPE